MQVKPLRENVLIKHVEEENGKTLPMSVKVGDHILFSKWSGTEIKVNGEPHLIIKEGDILAIVER